MEPMVSQQFALETDIHGPFVDDKYEDFPSQIGDVPVRYVKSPEGNRW